MTAPATGAQGGGAPAGGAPAGGGEPFGGNGAGESVAPCPLQKHWVEIELVGDDDLPVPKVRYRISPSEGEPIEGVTDEKGRGGAWTLPAGNCEVTFPDLDASAWEKL